MILWIIKDYFAEAAFLHGNLKEETFIKISPGYYEFLRENGEKIEGNYFRLEKSTYRLVQAPRSWWNKFTTTIHHHIEEQFGTQTTLKWQLLIEKNWCNWKGVLDHLRWPLFCASSSSTLTTVLLLATNKKWIQCSQILKNVSISHAAKTLKILLAATLKGKQKESFCFIRT